MSRLALLPVLLLFGLAACAKPAGGDSTDAPEGAAIPCALAGAAEFKSDCTVERSKAGEGVMLILHHPDGGFRRLQVATDGRGVVTADGADVATVKIVGADAIEVAVGDDRYRLPATVKGQAGPAQ